SRPGPAAPGGPAPTPRRSPPPARPGRRRWPAAPGHRAPAAPPGRPLTAIGGPRPTPARQRPTAPGPAPPPCARLAARGLQGRLVDGEGAGVGVEGGGHPEGEGGQVLAV